MHKRRKTRELALQVLFLWDVNGEQNIAQAEQACRDVTDDESVRREAIGMATGAWDQRQVTDPWIERIAPQWPPRRQPGVDRALIRLAVWELMSTTTPPKVVLDEAIELAKEFSTEQSPSFINGVLDAVLREKNAITGQNEATNQHESPRNES